MKYTKQECQTLYLEWLNNYLSEILFAEHHNLTIAEVENIFDVGRKYNKLQAEKHYKETGKVKQNCKTLEENKPLLYSFLNKT
jgi:hypothetical protein